MAHLTFSSFVLFVSDVTKSKDFFINVLDQEVSMDINNINVGFKSGLAIWDKNHATSVIFGNQKKIENVDKDLEIYFETTNLDDTFNKIKGLKINILHEIITQPWQQRVFRFYDPDNNIIEVAETME